MDKKTLEALNNFAYALEELVETFEKKAKQEEDFGGLGGVFSGQQDINNTLTHISESIDNIKESQKTMINNQEKILAMNKDIKASQESKGVFSFGNSEESKKGIKDGVSAIILIAAGVLAVGLAFQVIGNVDFASVIALSIAMPLVAYAFIEIATAMKEKGVGMKAIGMSSMALITMVASLTAASWILWLMKPVSAGTFMTAIAISAMFVVLSYAIAEAIKPTRKMKVKQIVTLPLIFVSMALAVTLSSWMLQMAVPIEPGLLFNLVLQTISLSIVAVALSVPMMVFKAFGLGVKDVAMGGMMLVIVAATAMTSSWLINLGTYDNYPSLMWAIGVGAALTVLSLPIIIMGAVAMSGIGLAAIALGGISALIVSSTIMAASHILNAGEYENYPGLGWVLGVGGAMLGFSTAMTALGFIMLTGVGAIALMLGGGAVVKVAETIVEVSKVLSNGEFGNAGDMAKWAMGVTLLYTTFTPILLLLGAVAMASSFMSLLTLGTSPDPFEAGKGAMIKIAETIRDVSFVLGEGNYSGGPTPEWAKGVGMAIGAFAPVFKTLSGMNIWSIFGGTKFSAEDYAKTIRLVSYAIIEAADVFRQAPTRWENGPTKKWAEGVGLSIGAFAPLFKILSSQGIMDSIFGTTVTPEKMGQAITVVAQSIMDAAKIFSKDNSSYTGGPTKKWAEGVGTAITSFIEVYEWVYDGIDWTPSDIRQADNVIYAMARSMMHLAKIFQGYTVEYDPATGGFKEVRGERPRWGGYPSSKWTKGVTNSILGFIELYEWVYDGVNWTVDDITEANKVIYKVARSIGIVARIMEPLGQMKLPGANTAGDLVENLKSWKDIVEEAESLDTGGLIFTAMNLMAFANGIDSLAKSLDKLNNSLGSLQANSLDALKNISGTFISFSVMDADNFDEVMTIVEDKSESLAELFGTAKEKLDASQNESQFSWGDPSSWFGGLSGGGEAGAEAEGEDKKTLNDLYNMLEAMDVKLANISANSTNLSNYVNELRANPEVKIK